MLPSTGSARASWSSSHYSSNPFEDVKPPSQVNESRKHFVTLQTTHKILDACPDAEWRLIVAICRFGGSAVRPSCSRCAGPT